MTTSHKIITFSAKADRCRLIEKIQSQMFFSREEQQERADAPISTISALMDGSEIYTYAWRAAVAQVALHLGAWSADFRFGADNLSATLTLMRAPQYISEAANDLLDGIILRRLGHAAATPEPALEKVREMMLAAEAVHENRVLRR